MPLNKVNQSTFHRKLYAGQLETVTLLKRGDDQSEGTVTAYVIFECRRSRIHKTGEPIQHDMVVGHTTVWHIPRIELDRIGVAYLSVLDRFVDQYNRFWQPESPQQLDIALFEDQLHVQCVRVDPPATDQ